MAIDNGLKQYFIMQNGDVVTNAGGVALVQAFYAPAVVTLTDSDGDPVWVAAAADAKITFNPPIEIKGLTAAGAGATNLVYVYLA